MWQTYGSSWNCLEIWTHWCSDWCDPVATRTCTNAALSLVTSTTNPELQLQTYWLLQNAPLQLQICVCRCKSVLYSKTLLLHTGRSVAKLLPVVSATKMEGVLRWWNQPCSKNPPPPTHTSGICNLELGLDLIWACGCQQLGTNLSLQLQTDPDQIRPCSCQHGLDQIWAWSWNHDLGKIRACCCQYDLDQIWACGCQHDLEQT